MASWESEIERLEKELKLARKKGELEKLKKELQLARQEAGGAFTRSGPKVFTAALLLGGVGLALDKILGWGLVFKKNEPPPFRPATQTGRDRGQYGR